MIKCPNCSAGLEFDTTAQAVKCKYCGSEFDPKELKIEAKKASEKDDTYEGRSYTCSQCGATLLTFDETAITFCSYCGSQAMIEEKLIKRNKPQFIIPFKKTKEECITAYKNKLSKSIFAPKYMKDDIVVSKFRGIYIPYCIYKLSCHGDTTNKGEKYSHRAGDYIYYDKYNIYARVDSDYDGISYDMLSNFYDRFSHAIPHNASEAEEFNVNYLAGFYADTADVDAGVYEDNAKAIVEENSIRYMKKERTYSKFGCNNPKAEFEVTEKKVGMFPVYFLAIRDKSNKYVNYAIVNGQTGKVVIDLPVDFKKYIGFSLLLTIPIFFLINWSIVLVPKTVCIIAIIASVISLIISAIQINDIQERESHSDDEGYIYVNKNKKKNNTSYIKYMIKQFLGIGIGFFVLVMNFVSDIYYYGAAAICLLLVILSFYDLVKEHNLIVSTKLPQLEKRGGSENETDAN